MTHGVLVYLIANGKVLLIQRRSSPNAAKWNGVAADTKNGERPHAAAVRAVKTQTGLTIDPGEPLGTVGYHHPQHGHWDVTVFRSKPWKGQPKKVRGVTTQWFTVAELPWKDMWTGDHLFVYRVLDEQPFTIDIWFDEKDNIVKQQVEFV